MKTDKNSEAGIIQTRSRTRADKAIAAHVGWVALPLDIIEKSGDSEYVDPSTLHHPTNAHSHARALIGTAD